MKTVEKVKCVKAEKRSAFDRHHVYILSVTWSDKKKTEIERAYSAFFDFKDELSVAFKDKKDVKLPELQPQRWFEKGILGSLSGDAAVEKKRHMIDDFCKQILHLPKSVVSSETVISFFQPWDIDKEPSDSSGSKSPMRPEKDRRGANLPTLVKQDSLDQPIPLQEQYIAIMDFVASNSGEVSLTSGCHVDVLQKDLSGWWFVMVEDTQKQGWAPGTMLHPADTNRVSVSEEPGPGALGMFRAVKDWEGRGDEVSYRRGDMVEVLNASMDGWWTVSCKGKVGCTPATNLEPVNDDRSDSKISRSRLKGSLYKHQSIYKKRSPPPRRQSNESISELYAKVIKKPKAPPQARKPLQYTEVAFDDQGSGKPVIVVPESSVGGTTYAEIVIPSVQNVTKKTDKPKKLKSVPVPPLLKSQSADVPELVSGVEDEALYENRDRSSSLSLTSVPGRKYSYENIGGQSDEKFYRVTHDYQANPSEGSMHLKKGDIVMTLKNEEQASSQSFLYCVVCSSPPIKGWVPKSVLFETNKESIDQSRHPIPVTSDVQRTCLRPPERPDKPQPSPRVTRQNNNHKEAPTGNAMDAVPTPSPRLPRSERPRLDLSPPKSPNTLVEAVFDYETGSPNCLSFQAGETGMLRRRNQEGWWCVELDGREGWVPADYWKELSPQSSPVSASPRLGPKPEGREGKEGKGNPNRGPWFVGPMSREDCERIMFAKAKPREFVIRESINRVDSYSLSVLYEARVRHFPIELRGENKYYIGKHDFKSLSKVIKYYTGKPIFYDDNKKPVCLGLPFLLPAVGQ